MFVKYFNLFSLSWLDKIIVTLNLAILKHQFKKNLLILIYSLKVIIIIIFK